jgi:hypothetical protein
MDCSRGENETVSSCRAIFICTSGLSVTGPTTGLSNPCLDTQHLLFLVTDCSRGGESGTESHCAIYACTLRVSVTVLACYGGWSVQSSDWNETASYFAIFICTSRLSATGPTTGLFNPCLNTQHRLCLVTDCSRGGEIGTESHCAIHACTLRVSVTVLAMATVQSSENRLLTW